jgi:hypothetical protein
MSSRFSQTNEAQCARYHLHIHAQSISRTILRVVHITDDFSVGTTSETALFLLAVSFCFILLTT